MISGCGFLPGHVAQRNHALQQIFSQNIDGHGVPQRCANSGFVKGLEQRIQHLLRPSLQSPCLSYSQTSVQLGHKETSLFAFEAASSQTRHNIFFGRLKRLAAANIQYIWSLANPVSILSHIVFYVAPLARLTTEMRVQKLLQPFFFELHFLRPVKSRHNGILQQGHNVDTLAALRNSIIQC